MNPCCQLTKTWADENRCLSVKQLMTMQDELNKLVKPGWKSVLSENNFIVALLDEMVCEVLGSGIDWKHWKYTDPSNFNHDNLKIEITDSSFFYLSLMIIWFHSELDPMSALCRKGQPYDQFDYYYVGSDKGFANPGVGIISGTNALNHKNYVNLTRKLIINYNDIFTHISNLDALVSSIGLSCEEFSAYYVAKEILNRFRQDNNYQGGTYEKVDIVGVEDNDRLHPLVSAFMEDEMMTLEQLKQNVINEFYEEVV